MKLPTLTKKLLPEQYSKKLGLKPVLGGHVSLGSGASRAIFQKTWIETQCIHSIDNIIESFQSNIPENLD